MDAVSNVQIGERKRSLSNPFFQASEEDLRQEALAGVMKVTLKKICFLPFSFFFFFFFFIFLFFRSLTLFWITGWFGEALHFGQAALCCRSGAASFDRGCQRVQAGQDASVVLERLCVEGAQGLADRKGTRGQKSGIRASALHCVVVRGTHHSTKQLSGLFDRQGGPAACRLVRRQWTVFCICCRLSWIVGCWETKKGKWSALFNQQMKKRNLFVEIETFSQIFHSSNFSWKIS